METILIKFFLVCTILAIGFGIYYLYQKQGSLLHISKPHNIQVIDTLQLEPRKKVTLLRCNGVNHLILSNQTTDILITSFNDNEKIDIRNNDDIKIMINKAHPDM